MARDIPAETGRLAAERKLLQDLETARASFDADPLQGTIAALDAAFWFLDSRGVVDDITPLAALRTALGDLQRGVVAPLFEPSQRVKGVQLARWMQRAIAAGTVDALLATGLGDT